MWGDELSAEQIAEIDALEEKHSPRTTAVPPPSLESDISLVSELYSSTSNNSSNSTPAKRNLNLEQSDYNQSSSRQRLNPPDPPQVSQFTSVSSMLQPQSQSSYYLYAIPYSSNTVTIGVTYSAEPLDSITTASILLSARQSYNLPPLHSPLPSFLPNFPQLLDVSNPSTVEVSS